MDSPLTWLVIILVFIAIIIICSTIKIVPQGTRLRYRTSGNLLRYMVRRSSYEDAYYR